MPSIPDTLRTSARRAPERAALIFHDRTTTYRELDARVDAFAAMLIDRGVSAGDRVLLYARNSDLYVIALYAALRARAIVVPANPANTAGELAHLLRDADATLVLAAPALVPVAVDAIAQTGSAAQLLALGEGAEVEDAIASARAYDGQQPEASPREDDDAMLLYTSGTTGRPKGALFDHHRLLWTGVNCAGAFGHRDDGRMLHVAPMYHAAELGIMLLPGIMLANTHVILEAFDPVVVADTLAAERITVFFGVPTMYQFLLRVPDLAGRDLSALRVGLFGAAPMPPSTVGQLLEALPGVELFSLCGQTEGGPGGIYSGPQDVISRPDASGRYPLPNTIARVVDKGGVDVAAGEVGELLLQGETVMKEYWRNPEATADTLRGGWLHTGDLGRYDADGYITLVDRLKDMIISGGRNVYCVEVENAVAAHPAVQEVAVVGTPHEDFGESIVAIASLREGSDLTLEELREFCRERLSAYKIPHRLVIAPIPRNPSGKVLKPVLRAQLQDA